jgi:hypothetical protein
LFSGLGNNVLILVDMIAVFLGFVCVGPILVRKVRRATSLTVLDAPDPRKQESVNVDYQSFPDARRPFAAAISLTIFGAGIFFVAFFIGVGLFVIAAIGMVVLGMLALASSVILAFLRRGPGSGIIRVGGSLLLALALSPFAIFAFG